MGCNQACLDQTFSNKFACKLETTGVDVQLNPRVTRDELLAAGFDDVIVATGVRMRMPSIPGIAHPKVLSYLQVLRDKAPVGTHVAIIGAGGIGFDTGEFLLHDPGHLFPQPASTWTGDWGVDLNATVEGGWSNGCRRILAPVVSVAENEHASGGGSR
jgi:2,4-dienoyl-CoA reductase (NADPH2)